MIGPGRRALLSRGPSKSGPSGTSMSLRSLGVDGGDCDLAQGLVRFLFLSERLIEQLDGIFHAEVLSPGLQGAVARNFIMLDGLRGCEQAGIERGRTLVFLHDLLTFVDDALDGIALLAAGGLTDELE